MTVKECYEQLGEDYGTVAERFGDDAMVRHFCGRFLQDNSFSDLTAALKRGDAEAAFRAVHTLKGVCLNLGFGQLGKAASDLTEYLRGRPDTEGCDALYFAVATEYRRVADALRML
ncbi:MAG TPA: Hpt domain-containing protein [Clostridiales bacterium]|nr:Hpt domain-containing protein [Clostridiales bacterium]